MCLIAYVPAGRELPEENVRSAAEDNAHGIGVMSAHGVAKFLGKKRVKRALRYIRSLQSAGAEFAVHFRFATHGRVTRDNCHPFALPGDAGWLMHNGVLTAYAREATHARSDTRVFVDTLSDVPRDASAARITYWDRVGRHISTSNKLCVMHADGTFSLVNEDSGDWLQGVWYSQTYSLPGYGYAAFMTERAMRGGKPINWRESLSAREAALLEEWERDGIDLSDMDEDEIAENLRALTLDDDDYCAQLRDDGYADAMRDPYVDTLAEALERRHGVGVSRWADYREALDAQTRDDSAAYSAFMRDRSRFNVAGME
jgi:hypothetical protein